MRGPNYSLARAAACRFSPPGPTAVVIITPPGRVITAVIVQACHSSLPGGLPPHLVCACRWAALFLRVCDVMQPVPTEANAGGGTRGSATICSSAVHAAP